MCENANMMSKLVVIKFSIECHMKEKMLGNCRRGLRGKLHVIFCFVSVI